MRKAFLSDALVLQARIPTPGRTLQKAESGAGKYHGEIAKGYDARREDSEKWQAEDRIMREMLADLPRGTSVLDIPIGTGRFLPLYEELGFSVLGIDISDDMLREASQKAGEATYLRLGDARDIDVPDQSYDVVVCIRLMRWLETNETQLNVLSELMRVARKRVIFNVRTETGPLPLSWDKIEAHVGQGWTISSQGIIDDFTMIVLERDDTQAAMVLQQGTSDPDGVHIAPSP